MKNIMRVSKKSKTKLVQNSKKEMPSNPIYNIDKIAIHSANHFILSFIHILNQSRKKYLEMMEKNVLTLMEQSMQALMFYS